MMMIPRRRDFDLLDDMFGDVFFNEGESKLMKTDIKEKKDEYIIDIDLPGYEKEGIKLNIQDGYLTVHATVNKEEKDEEMREMLKEELSDAKKRVEELEKELKIPLLPKDPNDSKNVIVENRNS